MAFAISINPALVTNAPGSFTVDTYGYIQGMFLDDPAVQNELMSGIVLPTATVPMWGGMAITESITNPTNVAGAIKSTVAPATAETNITGFSVFNQAHAMYNSPQSPVPLAPPSGGINFFRLGSNARIVVACSAAVAAALLGSPVDTAVYWDYTNQVLLNAPGGTALPVKVVEVITGASAQTLTYSTGTGYATWGNPTYPAVAVIQI